MRSSGRWLRGGARPARPRKSLLVPSPKPGRDRLIAARRAVTASEAGRRIILEGDDAALETLAPLLPEHLIRIVRDQDGWAVAGPDVDAGDVPTQIMEAGDLIASYLQGVGRL